MRQFIRYFFSVFLFVTAIGARAMGVDERILNAIDLLIAKRNESMSAIATLAGVDLREAGSTEFFTVKAGPFAPANPFGRLEVRKPHNNLERRGLIILEIGPQPCLSPAVAEAHFGAFDDLEAPLAGGPSGRPVDRTYRRPWGTLSLGFVNTPKGECLSRAIIDWNDGTAGR